MQLFEGPRQPGVRLAFAASPRASQVRQLCKMILNFVAGRTPHERGAALFKLFASKSGDSGSDTISYSVLHQGLSRVYARGCGWRVVRGASWESHASWLLARAAVCVPADQNGVRPACGCGERRRP